MIAALRQSPVYIHQKSIEIFYFLFLLNIFVFDVYYM